MRTIILILIGAVVALIVLIQTGLVSVNQTGKATLPTVEANSSSVTANAGHPPSFEVQTGSVAVGQQTKQVKVPTIRLVPANDQASGNDSAGK